MSNSWNKKKSPKNTGSSIMNDGAKARQFIKQVLNKPQGDQKAFKIEIDQKTYQVRELG